MARNTSTLKAVKELLDETIEAVEKLDVSKSNQSSARDVLVKLRRARDVLNDALVPDYTQSSPWCSRRLSCSGNT